MNQKLHPLPDGMEPPKRFTYPFAYEPHPLCRLAAQRVQQYIASHADIKEDADRGKMFGVLVVTTQKAQNPQNPHESHESPGPHETQESPQSPLYFLAAYSGLLARRNDWEYFVPPVYDAQQPDGYFKTKEREISQLSTLNCQLSTKQMSQDLQRWLFHQYQLLNARGETQDLVDIWQKYYSRPKLQRKYPFPPAGTGDCCAPKLLQYAYQQQLKPLCMAEFWWGRPNSEELRQHLSYYPACRGKCKPILTWMLQGLDVDPDPESLGFARLELPVVYEDDDIVVVDKPSGLLSTPGRIEQYSVETIMQQRYPGSIIAHRLDMGTSGLLIVCKSLEAYRPMQEQFVRHEVRKKYLALLEAPHCPLSKGDETGNDARLQPLPMDEEKDCNLPLRPEKDCNLPLRPAKGRISLPLRPDPMNRPRQIVDLEHGKRAVTDYEFLSDPALLGDAAGKGRALVALYPQTGRTHQLRIHCAHPDGLGCPIVGDVLYGTKGERLLLHAAEIWFRHPVTNVPMHLVSPVPFL